MDAGTTRPAVRGHLPTLVASFLHFDVSFMLWVSLGALGIYIAEDLGLSAAEKGLLVAIPILSGALLRIPAGLLSDRFGGKRVGVALLGLLVLPLGLGWQAGTTLPQMLAIGLLLGSAGASFAVALPLASRWYPPERQGLVMGIAAAGNSGTVLANLAAPRLASIVGWHNVLGLAMVPLLVVFLAFLLLAKDSPAQAKEEQAGSAFDAFKRGDLWWLCLFYSVTFGGYVGLSSFLPIFLHDQYQVSPLAAGYLTAAAAFVGSAFRPLGGYLADRIGGVRLLSGLLAVIGGVYALVGLMPPLAALFGLVLVGMACLGAGNGAVFQLVPMRFPKGIGAATGVIGALGGLGGFLLPNLLGSAKGMSGSFGVGFIALAGTALGALVVLRLLVTVPAGWWRLDPAALGAQAIAPAFARSSRVLMAPYWQ